MSAYSEPRLGGKAAAICMIGKSRAESLAAELLSMIFLEVISTHERNPILILPTSPESVPQENEVATKPLHILTHVCRYWRDVAFGNPALCQRVHSRHHDQMQGFLERSHPLTVALFLDVVHWGAPEEGPMPAPMESVTKMYSARLRRLDLSMVPARQNLSPVFTSLQANYLEVLTITSPCVYHSSSAGSMSRDLLLNSETSPLKALAVMPIVNWIPSRTPFPHLTHIYIFISFDAEPGLVHPFDILELLSNSPALSFVHVDTLIFDVPYSSNWLPPSGGVPFPQLRSLVITNCSYKLMHIFVPRLLLPDNVFVHLQGVLNELEADGYPIPLPPFALRPITCLDIYMEHEQVRMVADGPDSGLWLDGCLEALEAPHPVNWTLWLLQLHKSIALSHITHLHVYLAFQPVFLPELLAQLPQVSHLAALLGSSTLDGDTYFNIVESYIFSPIQILCRALALDAPTTAYRVRCPHLHTLLIEWEDMVTYQAATALPSIPTILTDRARAGYPIRRVVLQAAPHPLSLATGTMTALDILRGFALSLSPDETEYEVVGREDGAIGLCTLRMRDVWRVEGEEKYWEVGEHEKAGYTSVKLENIDGR